MNMQVIGVSRDGKANRWLFSCNCGNSFEPRNASTSVQCVTCPRCGALGWGNHNEQTIETFMEHNNV